MATRQYNIFHPSKLWKAKFFILCDVPFLVRLQGKFNWNWSVFRSERFNLPESKKGPHFGQSLPVELITGSPSPSPQGQKITQMQNLPYVGPKRQSPHPMVGKHLSKASLLIGSPCVAALMFLALTLFGNVYESYEASWELLNDPLLQLMVRCFLIWHMAILSPLPS